MASTFTDDDLQESQPAPGHRRTSRLTGKVKPLSPGDAEACSTEHVAMGESRHHLGATRCGCAEAAQPVADPKGADGAPEKSQPRDYAAGANDMYRTTGTSTRKAAQSRMGPGGILHVPAVPRSTGASCCWRISRLNGQRPSMGSACHVPEGNKRSQRHPWSAPPGLKQRSARVWSTYPRGRVRIFTSRRGCGGPPKHGAPELRATVHEGGV